MPDKSYEDYIKTFVDAITRQGDRTAEDDYGDLKYAIMNQHNMYDREGQSEQDMARQIIGPMLQAMSGQRIQGVRDFGNARESTVGRQSYKPDPGAMERPEFDADEILKMLLGSK